ncbi:hypothetical protein FRC02_007467 [Tulasnella sp. 418]|nr:hypothetical protein FRC02_007467 [Tulasnella sp. 418]
MASTPEDIELAGPDQYETLGSSELATSKPSTKPTKRQILVDENHPFDLEAYVSSYSGRAAAIRLIFIANSCPPLAVQAYQLAIQYIQQTPDANLYLSTLTAHNAIAPNPIPQDQKWLDDTISKNSAERDRLEVDLKTYASNMIKESIRMSHRELGKYYQGVGDYASSLKHFMRSREFCITSGQVLEMCISVLEVLAEQQNYGQLSTYVFKAESAFESPVVSMGGPGKKGIANINPEREIIQCKLEFCTALSDLGQARYEKAAYGFLKMGKSLGDWNAKIVAPSDIAIYGTICALASLSRSAIRAAVLESDTFAYYLEQEPYVRELLDAYMNSKFKDMLLLLERYSTRHLLDPHLAPHIPELTRQIQNRATVLYFQPFSSVHLVKMAAAFGVELAQLEASIVSLIDEGLIKGRIDSTNKILKAKDQDPRQELYRQAIETGLNNQASTRKLLYRMRLLQADLVVKAPKQSNREQQSQLQSQQSQTTQSILAEHMAMYD